MESSNDYLQRKIQLYLFLITISSESSNDYLQRKIQGISLFNNSNGCNDIASKLRVSYSTARRYKKYANKNSNQGELF